MKTTSYTFVVHAKKPGQQDITLTRPDRQCPVTFLLTCRPNGISTCSSVLHKKGIGSPYSIAERRVPELVPVLGSQPAGEVSYKPDGRLPLFSAGPSRGSYQFRCLVNRSTMGVNCLPKTVNGQRRGCNLNPGPSAPESSKLTARLPRHPFLHR